MKMPDEKISVREETSSLAEFAKKPLPTDEEVENFEGYIKDEVKEGEIDESLSEIYKDESGRAVDVKKMIVKKRRGFLFWLFFLLFAGALAAGAYYAYNKFLFAGASAGVEFFIDGRDEVFAGEEFIYAINYKNTSGVELRNAVVEVNYPENFALLDATSSGAENERGWRFDSIAAGQSGKIQIRGKIIAPAGQSSVITAAIIYTPANFSSEFRREAAFTSAVKDIGLDLDFKSASAALVGEKNEIAFKYSAKENNFLKNFRLSFEPVENMEFAAKTYPEDQKIETIRPGAVEIGLVGDEEREISFPFKFSAKKNGKETINVELSHKAENGEYYIFYKTSLEIEVMKSDLNLTLIINGQRTDQGVNFGDTLNYSIVYANKGETDMKDVVIMAVIESDFLEPSSLKDKNNGAVRGNAISWSKEEIPALASLGVNVEGTIDFFVKIKDADAAKGGGNYEIKSYAQFSVGGGKDIKGDEDAGSNVIINKINTDLNIKEEARYFSKDNIPVGSGPLPPKVGEITSYKIYWTITNNMHEVEDLKVYSDLPDYVSWNGKNLASAGTVEYDSKNHRVIWYIGRLPVTVFEAEAEFSISVSPRPADAGKIMVLLAGAQAEGVDRETKAEIKKTTSPKTTRLEDDDIAAGDGVVTE